MTINRINDSAFRVDLDGRPAFTVTHDALATFDHATLRHVFRWTMTAPDSEPVSFIERSNPASAARFVVKVIARGIMNAIAR